MFTHIILLLSIILSFLLSLMLTTTRIILDPMRNSYPYSIYAITCILLVTFFIKNNSICHSASWLLEYEGTIRV